jgi:GTP 3',8-cyclase
LRMSLTPRCNYRCMYCNPHGIHCGAEGKGELSVEEFAAVAQAAAAEGVEKIRLTGGEPLLYSPLPQLISRLRTISTTMDISLTSNGSLLASCAAELCAAGLNRINISLDSLQKERYRAMTGGGSLRAALRGIEAARNAGLKPLKINTVVMRGINDDEIGAFAQLAHQEELEIRFIEYMPFGINPQEWKNRFISMAEVEDICRRHVVLGEERAGNGPAVTRSIGGSRGSLGFIAPFHRHFCTTCNRLRLTADGKLRPCLFSGSETDIRPALRQPEKLRRVLRAVVRQKGKNRLQNMQTEGNGHCGRQMYQIGG